MGRAVPYYFHFYFNFVYLVRSACNVQAPKLSLHLIAFRMIKKTEKWHFCIVEESGLLRNAF
jgi:hypothetical protein